MRCISSAYRYAETHHCSLMIIWCALDELNCDFKSLFSFIGKVRVKVISIPYADERYFGRISYRILKKMICNRTKRFIQDEIMEENKENLDNSYIRTCTNWYPTENPYSMFQPNAKWYVRVNAFFYQYGENLLGVHIRRTDNSVSIQSSPIESFYKKIDAVIEQDGNETIYVASDDNTAIKQMLDRYPLMNVVYLKDVERSRDSKKGIIDAAVELYILANCKAIVGSYYSSFTDTAADINGIKKYLAISGENQ